LVSTQVFTLLEAIYAEFDRIAARRRVFKVETVGDCYVAVSERGKILTSLTSWDMWLIFCTRLHCQRQVVGLPDPRKDHALVMAKFARDCLYRFETLTKELEKELGPDTVSGVGGPNICIAVLFGMIISRSVVLLPFRWYSVT
jgi:hypothetical protein